MARLRFGDGFVEKGLFEGGDDRRALGKPHEGGGGRKPGMLMGMAPGPRERAVVEERLRPVEGVKVFFQVVPDMGKSQKVAQRAGSFGFGEGQLGELYDALRGHVVFKPGAGLAKQAQAESGVGVFGGSRGQSFEAMGLHLAPCDGERAFGVGMHAEGVGVGEAGLDSGGRISVGAKAKGVR